MAIDISTPEKFRAVFKCDRMRLPTVAESVPLKVIDDLFIAMEVKHGMSSHQIFAELGYADRYVAFTHWMLDCPDEVLDYCRAKLDLVPNPELEDAPLA